jgi:hypothetical protein
MFAETREILAAKVGTMGEKGFPVILFTWRLYSRHLGIIYMPQIYDMEQRLYFPSEGRRAEDFFALKNPTASAGFEPRNLGTKGKHATSRPSNHKC